MKVYVLLDRSGSMNTLWNEATAAVDTYIKGLSPETGVYVAAFDNKFTKVRDSTVSMYTKIAGDTSIFPRGMTALIDSAMRVINRIKEDNPEKAVFVVMTDGFENASRNYQQLDLNNAIDRLKKRGIEVIFLGANFDKIGSVSASFGVGMDKFANIKPGEFGSYALGLCSATRAYGTAGASINAADIGKKVELNVNIGINPLTNTQGDVNAKAS